MLLLIIFDFFYNEKYIDYSKDLERRRVRITENSPILTLLIFCYKEFEKFAPCKSVSQFIVYSDPIESGHVKNIFFVMVTRSKSKQREHSKKTAKLTNISELYFNSYHLYFKSNYWQSHHTRIRS